jgi:hypothetical protein
VWKFGCKIGIGKLHEILLELFDFPQAFSLFLGDIVNSISLYLIQLSDVMLGLSIRCRLQMSELGLELLYRLPIVKIFGDIVS